MRCLVVAIAAALPAGLAKAAILENPAMVPAFTPPAPPSPAGLAPGSDLILWRNLGTAFDDATALRTPGLTLPPEPALPGKSVPDNVLEIDLFGTLPVLPALP